MNRRKFLQATLTSAGLAAIPTAFSLPSKKLLHKSIPSSGETLPAIGMGSFVSFNFPDHAATLTHRTQLLSQFFDLGGKLIDSSPMYGSAEQRLGTCLSRLKSTDALFSATKVWTSDIDDGVEEIALSQKLWQVNSFDLLQVHNLLSWQGHLETLFEMKAQGRLRYVGITTSHGRRHRDLETIMRNYPIDFVQATYNAVDTEVDQRILPLAHERGIAFIANRPFQRGSLVDRAKQHPLPAWAADLNCNNWASLLLKYIVSHPAVTCAIPATTNIAHLAENMQAMTGPMPDNAMRNQISKLVGSF